MGDSTMIRFAAADGTQLRGRIRRPASGTQDQAAGLALLAHPHPGFGGNMDVWLLPTLAERLAADGWTTLRFDFRPSAGEDANAGHPAARSDLAAAVDTLLAAAPEEESPVALVGWSFGALIALLHALDDPRVTHWVGIAPPTRVIDAPRMAALPDGRIATWHGRRTVIVGAHEQFFPPDTAHALAPHHLVVLEHTDHFLFDQDREVAEAVAHALSARGGAGPSR